MSNTEKITKAVIPAAGLGTRFLPATKSVPKELLPIVDRPIILHIVEEAVAAGIEDIVFIAGRNKEAIEDFFDTSYELQETLEKAGKHELAKIAKDISQMVNVISVRQKSALGLGHAVMCGQYVVGNKPFAVMLGDEIMITDEKSDNVIAQLIQSYNKTGLSTVAVMKVPKEDVHKYGIIDCQQEGEYYRVNSVVEKPPIEESPSQLALPGRYVFDSVIFDYLRETPPGKNGEIQLTDAMTQLAKNPGLLATTFTARRYDAGDKLGYLIANIDLALMRPELAPQLKAYLKTIV